MSALKTLVFLPSQALRNQNYRNDFEIFLSRGDGFIKEQSLPIASQRAPWRVSASGLILSIKR